MKKTLIASLGLALLAGVASAQFTVDGTRDAAYPGTITYQTNDTGFGDNTTGNLFNANGSELNGAYAQFESGFLNLILTGNLETNFNKLEIYFDAPGVTTGQNTLNTTGGIGALNGLTFDTGFAPDYLLSITAGNGAMYVDSANLVAGTAADTTYVGTNDGQSGGVLTGGTNPSGLLVALNNSNVGGVGGTTGFSGTPSSVNTGVELRIPLGLLGNASYASGLRISAMINGSGHDFLSNQVLGGLPSGTGNLGNPSAVNFNNIAGNQYFAVPEPASMAALGLGLAGIVARRRRRSK